MSKSLASAYHSGESEADNSQTPLWLIRQLEDIVNVEIIHDVCATKKSAKAISYWTKEDDALSINNWHSEWDNYNGVGDARSVLWMNPPFSLARQFTLKAAIEARKGVVTLGCVKHAPDADWFQEMEKQATVIYVPDGRIQFLKSDGSPFTRKDKKTGREVRSGANFPICFPLWTPFNHGGIAKQVRFKRDQKGYEE